MEFSLIGCLFCFLKKRTSYGIGDDGVREREQILIFFYIGALTIHIIHT